ncbi:MAG: 4-alpha-glucanotransferase [Actinomycetota bacterium]|nr:4-alpha-glucanotransferase [Actinomycetota bacterium]
MVSDLERRAKRWGVALSYKDFRNERREVAPETAERAIELMGGGDAPPSAQTARVVRQGSAARLGKGTIETEQGHSIATKATLPRDTPLGYHRFITEHEDDISLIVAPPRCYLPRRLREWGWAIQLYALHSKRSWGIGDLDDLESLGQWAHSSGAGAVMINPLHAPTPGPRPQSSPYSPGSRLFGNPLYISVEQAAESFGANEAISRSIAAGRRLTEKPLVDREAVYRLKMRALERIWERARKDDGFARFRKERGSDLELFATFSALAEVHGSNWHEWPAEFSSPQSRSVKAFAKTQRDRVEFHCWLQFVFDAQSDHASRSIGLIGDLAVGVDPTGPDAWMLQDVFAREARVGAPPDEFNLRGQDWGVLPFDPHRLASLAYRPFIDMVRANLRNVAGLRLDHVMGLWRLYWVIGDDPSDGTYVRYPSRELLDIVCLESVRAEALIVGEDLGTVEPEVRKEMAARKLLSYRILWFEDRPPSDYPRLALAAISNHDLPTVAGVWTGKDVTLQEKLGLDVNYAGEDQVRRRARKLARVKPDAPVAKVTARLYEALGAARSSLTLGTLEDACGSVARPNYPGTTAEENWSRRLPLRVEQLARSKKVGEVVAAIKKGRVLSR